MKLTNIFAALCTAVILASCSGDDIEKPTISIADQGANVSADSQVTLSYDITKSGTLTFSSSDSWEITNTYSDQMTISPLSGKSGSNTVKVKATDYNCSNSNYEYSFTITSKNSVGSATKDVKVVQKPVFTIDTLYYEASAEGDTLTVIFNTDVDLDRNGFYVYYDPNSDFVDMWDNPNQSSRAKGLSATLGGQVEFTRIDVTRSASSDSEWEADIVITANTSSSQRNGIFCFGADANGQMLSADMEVLQMPAEIGTSVDMSDDGKTATLLSHTKGSGVPIVIMGDGFLDTDIASGKYREATQQACDYLFTIQPMKALKEYFDVYEVTAVSQNNTFSSSTSTAFSSKFAGGSSTEITGDDDTVVKYAEKVVSEKNIDDALILVILNDTRYAGTCSMYRTNTKGDIPGGYSIAYIPMVASSSLSGASFEDVLHHEAIGHGFAKLADEYYYDEMGAASKDEISDVKDWQAYGCLHNISVYSDVTKSYWSDFAADDRYSSEALGCYEGADTYTKGVYRPTQNSIMNDNTNGFNAPSRMMIYKRCMSIAMGSSWKYDFETFAAFDLQNTSSASNAKRVGGINRTVRPLGRPIMHKTKR